MTSDRWIVITTINSPSRTAEGVAKLCAEDGWSAVVVGDTKTPSQWHHEGITFLSVADQRKHFGDFADQIPYGHYCRKNLGYMYAIENGATVVLETDDDNNPYESFGRNVQPMVDGRLLSGPGWINVYPHFLNGDSTRSIWPRGLPLDAIGEIGTVRPSFGPVYSPIQQFLADNDPDVDAIYRLTVKTPLFFSADAKPVVLARKTWVPFNSQNTVFFSEAFPLLYLPCHVSFRMTDIWRSFVAQAALGHHGWSLSFHAPTVEQLRNDHDLMRDFAEEVVGYLRNREIGEILARSLTELSEGHDVSVTGLALWRALVREHILPPEELPLIEGWFERIRAATQG